MKIQKLVIMMRHGIRSPLDLTFSKILIKDRDLGLTKNGCELTY